MATINVEVNGRTYVVGCEDGQEEHVRTLARQFDKQVRDVAVQVGGAGELRLFLLAALTTADELAETRTRLDRLQNGSASAAGMLRSAPSPDAARVEQRAAAALEEAARRVEALAEQVA
jgi:cell division protein ZapA